MGSKDVELGFAFHSPRVLGALWALMTHWFWTSRFIAWTDKRQPTSFWLIVVLFLWNAWVPLMGDHEQLFKISYLSSASWCCSRPDFVGNRCGVQWCVNGSLLSRSETGTSLSFLVSIVRPFFSFWWLFSWWSWCLLSWFVLLFSMKGNMKCSCVYLLFIWWLKRPPCFLSEQPHCKFRNNIMEILSYLTAFYFHNICFL